jgi:hypothetical protein
VLINYRDVFGPDGQDLNCTDCMLGFMGYGKPGSLVITLSNHPSLLRGGLWRENEATQDDGQAGRCLGAKTSSREKRPDFELVGTLWTVIVREIHGATHMTCWSCSSPTGCTPIQITVTLLDMSVRLFIAVNS